MQLRPLGRTGLVVSEIGFGCGPTGALMIGDDEAAQAAAVARALALGVTYFDTAPVYGAGRSEIALGRALRAAGASATVATKVVLEHEDLTDIAGAVERSVTGSLERLGRSRLDIVHVHNRIGSARAARAEYGSGALLTRDDFLGPRGLAATLEAMQHAGIVGPIGCCAYGGDPVALRALIDDGRFASILVNYSLLNTSAWEGMDRERDYGGIGGYAAEQGLAVIALRALEAGRLTQIPIADAPDNPLNDLRFLRAAGDPIGKAIRFALANTDVSSLLIGFSDLAQIEHAAAAAAEGPLDRVLLDEIAAWRACH